MPLSKSFANYRRYALSMRYNLFLPKTNLMAVAVSDFVINNEMQSLKDEKYLLMKKKIIVT